VKYSCYVLGHQLKYSCYVLGPQLKYSCYVLGHQVKYSCYVLKHQLMHSCYLLRHQGKYLQKLASNIHTWREGIFRYTYGANHVAVTTCMYVVIMANNNGSMETMVVITTWFSTPITVLQKIA
jgi:hypothetical protein